MSRTWIGQQAESAIDRTIGLAGAVFATMRHKHALGLPAVVLGVHRHRRAEGMRSREKARDGPTFGGVANPQVLYLVLSYHEAEWVYDLVAVARQQTRPA